MIAKIYESSFFAKLFTVGLLLLFIDTLRDFFGPLGKAEALIPNSNSFFVIGLTICLISFLFLLIEWMTVPFGTQTKRIKLYQGAGNLFAFTMLVGGYLLKGQAAPNTTSAASLTVSSSGLMMALIFGWVGSAIANYISSKKIKVPAVRQSFEKFNRPDSAGLGESIMNTVAPQQASQN